MKIDAEMVDYIARLSRLELQPGEKRAMTEELERIVAYMDVLDRLDAQGVREDEVGPSQDRGELLAGSPGGDREAFLAPKAVE